MTATALANNTARRINDNDNYNDYLKAEEKEKEIEGGELKLKLERKIALVTDGLVDHVVTRLRRFEQTNTTAATTIEYECCKCGYKWRTKRGRENND
jgi:hypothetical protein